MGSKSPNQSNIVIHMWSTGELTTEYRHVKKKKCMVIRRPLDHAADPVVIPLEDMHYFYPEHQEEWIINMHRYAICAMLLNLPPKSAQVEADFKGTGTAKRLLDYIQDGFDKLKDMKPMQETDKQVVGEFEATVNGRTMSGEMTE